MNIPNDCSKCKELVKSRKQIVFGCGDKNADIMFIGICPGNHMLKGGADSTGIPFKGDGSGKLFEKLLNDLELTRSDVYTTNLVKCRPAKIGDLLYNRLPTEKEIENCRPNVISEIRMVNPKVVLCMGKIPYNYINKIYDNCPILYVWHPGFLLRNRNNIDELYNKWIKDIRYHIEHWTKPVLMQKGLDEYGQT